MGVVFFPSLPFMGVMLFPNFTLGNASGEGGAPLVPFSPFSILFSLPLLSSSSPSFHSLFLPFKFFSTSHSPIFCFFFSSTSLSPSSAQTLSTLFFLLLLFSTSFSFPFFFLNFFFFFRELLILCASKM